MRKNIELETIYYMGKDKKTCTKCKETKELSCFPKDRSRKDGHTSQCKACRYPKAAAYRETDKYKKSVKRYNENSKEYKKQWRQDNYAQWLKKRKEWNNSRYANDIGYRLGRVISSAVTKMLKGVPKNSRTFEALPYTPQQLKEHLESQFEDWMTWDNYGDWHVDHIFPQSLLPYDSFDHPNFIRCWSLDNLRPLEARENIIKSNKILDQFL